MPSASSTLFFFASLLGAQARVLPDACPALCSDTSVQGTEHHRLQDLTHCGKNIHYNEVFRVNDGELIPEISICSHGDAVSVEEKRDANKNLPAEHDVDFHVFSKSSGQALDPWDVNHLADSISRHGEGQDLPDGSPWWVEVRIDPGNTTMGVYAGPAVDYTSLSEAIRGWSKQFVNGTSTFAAQYCGMAKDRSIGFVFDGQGLDMGVVAEYMGTWQQDECVMDFEKAHVWQDIPVTFKNDVWRAVENPVY